MLRMPHAKGDAADRPRVGGTLQRRTGIRPAGTKAQSAGGPQTIAGKGGIHEGLRKTPPSITRRSIGRVLRILRMAAPGWNAPVLTLMAAERRVPFLTLIGCILSLRTKDQATAIAAPRLFARADTPSTMLELSQAEIEGLIYPVGFYRTKARVIRQICRDLLGRFDGEVPDRIDDLLTLNGVGRKTANLVVTEAFRKPGICVDTHVHRISNRWGLIKAVTPEKSETALREILPRRYWIEYNSILVAFGQTICQPVSPWCSRCPVSHLCPRIGLVRSR
jgi:endonuclease-3